MFGGLTFQTRKQLLISVTSISLVVVQLLSLAHILWYGYRWYTEEVTAVSLFCQTLLGQIAVRSMFHKHELMASRTSKDRSELVLNVKLMMSASLFAGLRLYLDKPAWVLVSTLFCKLWIFGAILSTPLIYEYFILPMDDEDQLGPLLATTRSPHRNSRPPSYQTVERCD